METATLNNQIFQIEHERSKRLAVQHSRGGVQRGSRAALPFDASAVWGSALAELLGRAAGGAGSVTGADIADSLRLCAIKLKAGDKAFVLESLAGQATILAQLMAEAARDYSESEANGKWQWARIRLKDFHQIQKAHYRVIGAMAAVVHPLSSARRL